MNSDQKKIEDLKDILRGIEFIEYDDPDEGLQIFCPVCGGSPGPERLSREMKAMTTHLPPGKGHDKNCKLAKAIS